MDMSMSLRNTTAAPGTILILSSQDLQTVMRFDDYVDAVAEAFRMLAEGRCESPVPLQVSVTDGTFHAKAASLPVGSGYVAVKVNGNFQDNRSRHGLPTIQGAVFLADANNGRPLALLDSIEITRQRTAAATAVATQYLARPDSRTATICGCGEQGRIQLRALSSTSRRFLHGTSTPKPHAAFQPRWRRNSGSTLRPLMICAKEHWSVMQL
jgi:alanine dehydrogenase